MPSAASGPCGHTRPAWLAPAVTACLGVDLALELCLQTLPHPVTGGEGFLGIGIRPPGVGTQPTSHTAKRFIRTSLPRGLFKLGTLMAIRMRVPRTAIIAVYAVDNGLSDSPCQIRFRRVRIARTMKESAVSQG